MNEGIEPGTRTAYAYCVRVLGTRTAYAYCVRVRVRVLEIGQRRKKKKKKNKMHACWAHTLENHKEINKELEQGN